MVSIDQIVEHRKANGVTGAAESRRPALLL
jgi:hypothetical protein